MLKEFDLGKIISLLGIMILCGAVLKHEIIFYYFELPLSIELQELIPLFLRQLLVLVIFAIIALLIIFILTPYIVGKNKNTELPNPLLETNLWKRHKLVMGNFHTSMVIAVLVFTIVTIILFFTQVNIMFKAAMLISSIILVLPFIFEEIKYARFLLFESEFHHATIFLVFFIVTYFCYILLFTTIEIEFIKRSNRYNTIIINTESDTIIVAKPSYIISNTQKYVYYYDGLKKQTVICPMSTVKRIIIHKFDEPADSIIILPK